MSFPRKRESSFHAVFMDSSLRWNDRLLYNFLFLSSMQFSFPHSTRKNHFYLLVFYKYFTPLGFMKWHFALKTPYVSLKLIDMGRMQYAPYVYKTGFFRVKSGNENCIELKNKKIIHIICHSNAGRNP